MVKCTINGKELEVAEGTSIIEAFKMSDQDIAHYCWHPGLSVAGVCRLCMVEVEGNPRLQIACNTEVREGMVITNQSEKVKDAVKWGLDFHLINHPLDCPICDQAGECGLQDQYMQFGKYDPEMGENKVKKQKVVDLGERVVLDSERCILCSRCVRFTEEVSKTEELGIFNRGDHSEIGTFDGKPLDNPYSVNTVDICPVGALTSKDFRFQQRVWFLEDQPSICTGCSTGCHVNVYHNKEGLWRVKPRHSEVNGYWMCDEGREIYKSTNAFRTEHIGERGQKKSVKKPNRVTQSLAWDQGKQHFLSTDEVVTETGQSFASLKDKKAALVLTGQYTNEELESFVSFWKTTFPEGALYHWKNHPDQWGDFDGLLIRGDKNPNSKGLEAVVSARGSFGDWAELESDLQSEKVDFLMVAGPENPWVYPLLLEKLDLFAKAKEWIYLSATLPSDLKAFESSRSMIWPMKTFAEKSGTFTNHAGLEQSFQAVGKWSKEAMDLGEMVQLLKGTPRSQSFGSFRNIKNEFVHKRGHL